MLTITKLRGAEYLIASVADGMEDYYMGVGEAPGVWTGHWSEELGLAGVVEADALRALVTGHDPKTGTALLAGHRDRKVRAVDVTLSVPKSVSVLWAFGSPETSSVVSIAVADATHTALGFLEERAALARVQHGGVRRRVATGGFAVATFAHRTSRAGDPQLHTHCLIPNVVRRADGQCVAFDANPLHVWAKATGTVFLNELERILTDRLGVEWGPDRNGSRELIGFSREQLRAFSKRTTAIETHLEAAGEVVFDSKAQRMRADDHASITTRDKKDRELTPERLRDRWHDEANAVGLRPGTARGRSGARPPARTSDRAARPTSCSPRWSTRALGCARRTPGSAKPTSSNASPPCRPVASRSTRSSRCRAGSCRRSWLFVSRREPTGAGRRNGRPSSTATSRTACSRNCTTSWPATDAASIRSSSRPRSPRNRTRWVPTRPTRCGCCAVTVARCAP